jgi:Ca2+-binding RTX toxin-like protein
VTDTAGVTATGGCMQDNASQATCPGNAMMVRAGDGDDQVTLQLGVTTMFAPYAYGEEGNDKLTTAGPHASGLDGGPGDDSITGGERQDLVWAGAGDDTILGRGGKDFIKAGTGSDYVDGGEGSDLLMTLLDPGGGDAGSGDSGVADDNEVDTVICGGNVPAPGDLDSPFVPPTDTAQTGLGDVVGADCEEISAVLTCPPGGTCEGVPAVTGGGAGAAGSAAVTAKKKKGGSRILGMATGKRRKVKVKGGRPLKVYVRMNAKAVNKALGSRSEIPAVLTLLPAKKKKKKKGAKKSAAARKIRFKLKR